MKRFNFISEICDKSNLFLFVGLGLLFYGLYEVYKPASFITIGIIFIIAAWFTAKPITQESVNESSE